MKTEICLSRETEANTKDVEIAVTRNRTMANFTYRPSVKERTGKLDLLEVLKPYAEYARLIEKEEGIKKTNNQAICWNCGKRMKGGE